MSNPMNGGVTLPSWVRDILPIAVALVAIGVGWAEIRSSAKLESEALRGQTISLQRSIDTLTARMNDGSLGTLETQISVLRERYLSHEERIARIESSRRDEAREDTTRLLALTQTITRLESVIEQLRAAVQRLEQRPANNR